MPDNRRIYQPDQAHAHETPRSARQTPRGSQWPDGKHPRHGVTIFQRRPIEQTPKRERISGK